MYKTKSKDNIIIAYAGDISGPSIFRKLTGEFTVTPQAIKEEVCEMLKCNGGSCWSSTSSHSTYSCKLSVILYTYEKTK